MPFFPRFHYPQHSTIFPNDIFQLLNEAASLHDTDTPSRRGFSPNFDVHETEHEYVLEGELPGLSDKKSVNLEFTDDNTLLVHGKIERSIKRYSDDQGKIQTIEDGAEQKKIEGGEQQKKEVEKEERRQERKPKYWVSERSVGEFSRSFSFPGSVDVERVKASLEHGILKIVVPKMEKKTGRRIEIA